MIGMRLPLSFLLTAAAAAQIQPLAPTSNLTLDTTATQGHFTFSSIAIPPGVRVRFSGDYPVQIRCEGDATIHGQLDADASVSTSGPGATTIGQGASGVMNGGCQPGSSYPPTDGRHAGLYGSDLPFSLLGGSPGGGVTVHSSLIFAFGCVPLGTSWRQGGGGGGTLVLEADGRIDVYGRVSANGDTSYTIWPSGGSGGSLLLRGLQGVTVHTGGLVQAAAGSNSSAGPGIIRLDAYGGAPIVMGIVDPPPLALAQPYLFETGAPVRGSTWELTVSAPRGDGVYLAASFQPGTYTGPYGTVGIPVQTAITFALVTMPATGHDPLGSHQLPVPPLPGLLGLNLWTAGLDWHTALPPRYSNAIHSVVQ